MVNDAGGPGRRVRRHLIVYCIALFAGGSACDSPVSIAVTEEPFDLRFEPGCGRTALACYPNCETYEAALLRLRTGCIPAPAGTAGRTTVTVGVCGSFLYIRRTFNDIPITSLSATRATLAFYDPSAGMIAEGRISDILTPGCPHIGQWTGLVPRCELRPTEAINCQ